ncbi:MAG: SDR family NAD(P)-dependent oxidoreductase [Acidobacteria bacterium]|nr:SDR family NAD(P)-dependent oxidoreductase [Acidobacteriota bacterium]
MTSSTSTRTVLITGTSSGIGLHTALAAASAGWTVVATMRDTTRAGALRAAADAAGVSVDIRALDVTDAAQIESVIAGIVADHGSLDAVVNNAGAGRVGTVELLSMEAIRDTMEVNFFGVVAVTKAAMPQLRASGGRVLTISSVGGIIGQPFNDAYCAAKFAVEGFLEALQPVAATVGVGVCVIEPGAVGSEFVANAGVDREVMLAAAGVYGPALSSYLARTAGAFANAQAVEEVGALVAGALELDPLPFRLQTSDGARAFVGIKLSDLDGSAVTGFTGTWVSK